MNLVLLVLLVGVTGVGMVQYDYEASDPTLERKRLKRVALEENHTRLQAKKQRATAYYEESTPDRATVTMRVMDASGAASEVDLNQGETKSAGEAAVAAASKANGSNSRD